MKQGIIFGILISIISFVLVHFLFPTTNGSGLDIIILQNGEEIFSAPLLYNEDSQIIWYVHDEEEIKVLVDDEIIEYFGLDLTVDELTDVSNLDYNQIFKVAGNDAEINMLVNTNGGVKVYEANCPDKIDVKIGEIRDTSKVITCAPHKLVIKLRGDGNGDELDA